MYRMTTTQEPLKDFEESYTIDRDGNIFGVNKTIPLKTYRRSSTSTTDHIVLRGADGHSIGFSVPELMRLQFGIGDGWEYVTGYDELYQINRQGQIFSCVYNKVMLGRVCESGYLCVGLVDREKQSHKCRIHRLLAIQYIPNPDNLPEVDHIDQNRQNNDLSNLRWVTKVGNMRNRKDSLHLKSPEEYEEWVVKKREYTKLKAREYRAKKKESPSDETPEEREARLAKHREYCKKYNSKKKNPSEFEPSPERPTPLTETSEQREERLAKTRAYNHKYLAKKQQLETTP